MNSRQAQPLSHTLFGLLSSVGKKIQHCRNLGVMWLGRVRFSLQLLYITHLCQFLVIPKILFATYCSVQMRDVIYLTVPICGKASSGGNQPAERIQEYLGFCNSMIARF